MAEEVLRGTLGALEGCALELHLPEDVLKVTIGWTKLQEVPAPPPVQLSRALQQHILSLQLLLEKLQSFVNGEKQEAAEDASTAELMETCAESVGGTEGSRTETRKEVFAGPAARSSTKEAVGSFDHEVVQIKAQKAEIDRRIMAFIERKQAEINENNVREFCNVIDCNQENSCARTDAVFTPYPGFKSHIKVSRVVNTYGPQTRLEGAPASSLKASTLSRDCGNQAVEERLQNIEAHLRLQTGGPVPKDIYMRIKTLEEKILELEGLSPEYFQSMGFSGKRRKMQTAQGCSLAELDEKIIALREKLLSKARESQSKDDNKLPL